MALSSVEVSHVLIIAKPSIRTLCCCRRLGSGAQKLLEEYTKVQGGRLSCLLKTAMSFDSRTSDSEDSSATQKRAEDVQQLLTQADSQISALLSKRAAAARPGSASHVSIVPS